MNNLIINIFNKDVECITELIACGFNVTHFERIALGVGKTRARGVSAHYYVFGMAS